MSEMSDQTPIDENGAVNPNYHYDPEHHCDQTPAANVSYNASDLEHLSDLEHVRQRPAMYIGDTAARGLHHLVTEVVDNSIDEVLAGFASVISVTINGDGSVTVEDNGRGIPVEEHPELKISTLEGVMTVLKFGGKFSKGAYQTSGGLHGVGVTVVNFLSEWCVVEIVRDGFIWQQNYERGIPTGPVTKGKKSEGHGTKTTFKPDPQIFPDTKFDYKVLFHRLQDLAFLNHGVKIVYQDARNNQGETFEYKNGLVDFIRNLNQPTKVEHDDVIYMADNVDGVRIEVAFQYNIGESENVRSYVNNIHTVEGGTHLSGFRSALTRSLNNYGKAAGLFKKDQIPTGEDFREGLTAVISMRVPNPRFEGQTKTKLGNSEVEGIVNSIVGEGLAKYLEEHPKTAVIIVKKGMLAAEARVSAQKARNIVRERKGALSHGGMPGKLRDCSSREMEKCELYLVEGNSAGGSAEGGRLREYQAILPLRGKVINAYKSTDSRVLANEEIRSMITAIGISVSGDDLDDRENKKSGKKSKKRPSATEEKTVAVPDETQNNESANDGTTDNVVEKRIEGKVDLSKRRYGKIVIMTDADVDGSHIRTLLLTFFYRQMYDLVKAGCVYSALPPLYKVRKKGSKTAAVRYVQTDEEMKREMLTNGIAGATFDPQDGRIIEGEALERLCRTLSQIEDSVLALERRGISLREHADRQDPVTARLPYYHVFWKKREEWFQTRAELDAFIEMIEAETGGSLAQLMSQNSVGAALSQTNKEPLTEENTHLEGGLHVIELYEVRSLNRQLADLREMGFEIDALIPAKRTGMEGARYYLRKGEAEVGIEDLRGLLTAIRSAGEKGYIITRFKGLGEMDPEELRETTLDPQNRTLIQVTMEDATAADDLFRVLMGDQVEPRRKFIENFALEVKNLDV